MPSKAAGSPVPAPSFPGDQEFFRDFIVAADSYTFNHHLTAAITARVAKVRPHFLSSTGCCGRDVQHGLCF